MLPRSACCAMTRSTNCRGDRLDVGVVGELRVGHDRRRVGVDQADLQPFGAQHPAGLGARVVELAGLSDDDRPGADHQDVVLEVPPRARRFAARSVQCGGSPRHQVHELVEEVLRVVRPGRRLGVVLHREGASVNEFDPFHHPVVGAGVAHLCGAERGVEALTRFTFQREAVVLRGDGDPPGGVIDDRHVDAAVPEHHLVRRAAQRAAEDLVAEADAEQRDSGAEHLAGDADDVVRGGRVSGSVGQEHTVGLQVGDLVEGRRRRQHVAADAAAGEVARRVGLDAQIDRGDGEPLRPIGFDDVGAVGADLARQVGTQHRRLAANPVQQLVGVGQRIAGEHPGLHRPEAAQVAHHGAGVDARDADDALPDEFVLERSGRPPVGCPRRRVADGVAGHPDLVAATFGVFVIPAGVADLRRGGDHDLAVIAGVGQRLLVARHAGGEHRLTERLADRAECGAGEDAAVIEDQQCLARLTPPPPPSHLRILRAVVATEPGVDLGARRQPPPDSQDAVMGERLAGDAAFGADGGDRLVGDPDRTGTAALQHDALGIAGQHRLGAVAEVADRDAVLPARRQRAADIETLGRRDDDRSDGVRHRRQRPDQLCLPLGTVPPAPHHRLDHQPDHHREHRGHDQRPDERAGVHAGDFPSRAVTLPRNSVKVTAPGSVIDSYGVLSDRLASSAPATVHVASGSTTVRLAGSPISSGLPWSGSPDDAGRVLAHHPGDVAPAQQPGPHHRLDDHRQRRLQAQHAGPGHRRTRTSSRVRRAGRGRWPRSRSRRRRAPAAAPRRRWIRAAAG